MFIEDKMAYYDKIVENQHYSLSKESSKLHIDLQKELDKGGNNISIIN
jgi:hypothetical protein